MVLEPEMYRFYEMFIRVGPYYKELTVNLYEFTTEECKQVKWLIDDYCSQIEHITYVGPSHCSTNYFQHDYLHSLKRVTFIDVKASDSDLAIDFEQIIFIASILVRVVVFPFYIVALVFAKIYHFYAVIVECLRFTMWGLNIFDYAYGIWLTMWRFVFWRMWRINIFNLVYRICCAISRNVF